MTRIDEKARPWRRPGEGAPLTWLQALDRLSEATILCLGEHHDRADIHLWQRDVIEGLLPFRTDIVVGVEMLPASSQPALDRWLQGAEAFGELAAACGWDRVWGFDPALYAPIFHLARDRGLPMRALNVDRDLVRSVGRDGWDAIPPERREGLSRPAEASAAYRRRIFAASGGARPDRAASSPSDPAFDRFARAQSVWDRAFAERMLEARRGPGAPLVVGLIGRGHLEHRLGVIEQLADLGETGAVVALTEDPGDPEAFPGFADYLCTLHPER